MNSSQKKYFKFTAGLVICLLIRLIPFRAPNIEPILATQMPFAKAYGAFLGFLFGILSIVFYDLLTHTLGSCTLVTAPAYGALGLFSALYFKNRRANTSNFIFLAIVGTLFFDAMTGLLVGPLFFHQSFSSALIGQIPFTILHLLGNIIFAVLLSPAIYYFVAENKNLKTESIIRTLRPKII